MKNTIHNRKLPIVAIVGRPNVGKSTLFNKFVGVWKAAVHDTPGLTRDRNYSPAQWGGRDFLLVDTGGYEFSADEPLLRLMREQTLMAVGEADVIVFLADANDPLNPMDDEVVGLLRKTRKPVIFAINKVDNDRLEAAMYSDFGRFGGKGLFGLSAEHGRGTGDLLDEIVRRLPAADGGEPEEDAGIRVAVVGRPNVGKSTLVNRLLGFERSIASEIPGTTRDAVDTLFTRDGQRYTLIDTAGIRRRGKVKPGPEKLSVTASVMSMERCDIALIVIDASQGITEQDAHVAGYAEDAGCGCILVVNKWDALPEKDHRSSEEFKQDLRDELGFLKYAPVVFVSATTGQRVEKLFGMIQTVYGEYTREIETRLLNEFLKRATTYLSPPMRSGRQLKMKYVTQTGSMPPTFTFFVNDPKLIHFSYERFLLNQMRAQFGFEGVPLRIRYRKKSDDRPPGQRGAKSGRGGGG